jgi:hypothetical protein
METQLSPAEIKQFISEGYVRIDNAFSPTLAEEARSILWSDTGCDPANPSTWTKAVIRLGHYSQEPFRQAANAPILHAAADQLVGTGRWIPRGGLGTFPIRFPSEDDPDDTGWHADAGFYGEDGSMRINLRSKGRALLMLFLFSDIDMNDAPTRILVGSHLDVASLLQPAGEQGLTFVELAQKLTTTLERKVVYATGKAGTVYLCHPFLIHGAQPNRGKNPRFLAQPPLQPKSDESIQVHRSDGAYSPVEVAIRMGLNPKSISHA